MLKKKANFLSIDYFSSPGFIITFTFYVKTKYGQNNCDKILRQNLWTQFKRKTDLNGSYTNFIWFMLMKLVFRIGVAYFSENFSIVF